MGGQLTRYMANRSVTDNGRNSITTGNVISMLRSLGECVAQFAQLCNVKGKNEVLKACSALHTALTFTQSEMENTAPSRRDQRQKMMQKKKKTTPSLKKAKPEKKQWRPRRPQYQVFLTGVPWEWRRKELKRYFASCGTIRNVSLPSNPVTLRHRGYAFISFCSGDSLKKALQLDGMRLQLPGR